MIQMTNHTRSVKPLHDYHSFPYIQNNFLEEIKRDKCILSYSYYYKRRSINIPVLQYLFIYNLLLLLLLLLLFRRYIYNNISLLKLNVS
jgi:hypothetical protein